MGYLPTAPPALGTSPPPPAAPVPWLGLSGKKVQYTTLPYGSVRSFEVESAGSFDGDSELKLWTRIPWLPKLKMEFRSDSVDIFSIQVPPLP